ncbi:MAG: DEAD/DEAH box helicase family protein [Cyanobacteria bacterium J06656_5]
MDIRLRDYQTSLCHRIFEAFQRHNRVIVQLPTGAGKTVCFGYVVGEFAKMGANVLVLAHRKELLNQAAGKLTAITGLPVGMVKAGIKPNYEASIQVASVQTVVNRLNKIPAPGLIIVDEAHHVISKTYVKILEAFPNAFVLGVTATPTRTDGKGFDRLFNDLVCGPSVKTLMEAGHLCNFRLFADQNPMTWSSGYQFGRICLINKRPRVTKNPGCDLPWKREAIHLLKSGRNALNTLDTSVAGPGIVTVLLRKLRFNPIE